jgi:Ice-binding-like/Bacterial Ig-like domain
MRALNNSLLVAVLLSSLAGCGQQLVQFQDGTAPGGTPGTPVAPTVSSTDPIDTATDVGVSRTVNATFSEQMDPATISTATFTLKQGTTPISGTVSYAGTTATFKPAADLSSNVFTATISTGAKSSATGMNLAANYTWTFTTGALPVVPLAINLGRAASFGLASRAGLTSTGVTVVNGDVALFPLATCTDATGGPGASSQTCLVKTYATTTGMTVNGSIFWAADPFDNGQTASAVTNDLNVAWNEGSTKVDTQGAIAANELGGKTFIPGVYHNANLGLAAGGAATLDAHNDANAIFIFKVDSDLIDSGTLLLRSRIILVNGAQARNVWFVAGRDVTIGSGTTWNGNILAGRTATIKDGSTVTGRVLAGAAGAGAITLTGAASPSVTTVTVPR